MNYGKLQLSFLLLLIMTIIQLLVGLFIIHKLWLVCTSLLAATLCVIGLVYACKKEAAVKNNKK